MSGFPLPPRTWGSGGDDELEETWAVAAVITCGTGEASARSVAGCDARIPSQIRAVDCHVAAVIEDALARSASLRRMVDRIGELKGIVYVTAPVDVTRKTTLAGGFFHRIVTTGETRMLWIAVAHEPRYSDHSIGILGHELRHVLEVLESPDARTEADVDALYNRISYTRGSGTVETDAALAMGQQVERELIAARRVAKKQ